MSELAPVPASSPRAVSLSTSGLQRSRVETTEYLAMLRRMLVAAGRRVAAADEDELAQLVALRDVLEEAIEAGVRGQRSSGSSLAQIGRGLGVSRQAVHKRWG
jgi:hypothetical protein